MEFKNSISSFYALRDIIEDYTFTRKAKALHKKQFAPVLSDLKAHYVFTNRDIDDEWFLNDLKNHDHQSNLRLNTYRLFLDYSYKTRNAFRMCM